ncbi:hypothetical protein Pint_22329 [Pistacia integerrima]|uniref:Uncharacterized protein n=1 Tax=Pistacia integerrima TaxID=434235 RepID=A0ACC0YKQ9_9ROSI|nr:hypothetical protein Pint_22329 [Pistacia integerrima]
MKGNARVCPIQIFTTTKYRISLIISDRFCRAKSIAKGGPRVYSFQPPYCKWWPFSLTLGCAGQMISWSSAGTYGFRGTSFVAQTAIKNAIRVVADQNMQRAEVMIKGSGLRRDATLRAICRSDTLLSFVRDVTPMPHNGC